jgi:hypothetical protein
MNQSINDKAGRLLSMSDCEMCFAVPDAYTIIDVINPETGLSWCYSKTLEQVRLEYPGAQIMTVAAHCEAKARRQDTPIEWLETTEERYWEMLEVLPPACMMGGGFLVGEASDHHAVSGQPRFQGFISGNGKYRQSSRPITRSEFQEYIRHRAAA